MQTSCLHVPCYNFPHLQAVLFELRNSTTVCPPIIHPDYCINQPKVDAYTIIYTAMHTQDLCRAFSKYVDVWVLCILLFAPRQFFSPPSSCARVRYQVMVESRHQVSIRDKSICLMDMLWHLCDKVNTNDDDNIDRSDRDSGDKVEWRHRHQIDCAIIIRPATRHRHCQ